MFGPWFGVAVEVWGSGTEFLPPCLIEGDKTYEDKNGALAMVAWSIWNVRNRFHFEAS